MLGEYLTLLLNIKPSKDQSAPKKKGEVRPPAANWPKFFRPYARLSRWVNTTESSLAVAPCYWGLLWGLEAVPSYPTLVVHALFGILAAGGACTINDIFDRNIDKKVLRSKTRPLAAGEVSLLGAVIWLGIQAAGCIAIVLAQVQAAWFWGLLSLAIIVICPLCKRFTNWPQIFVGLVYDCFFVFCFLSTGRGLHEGSKLYSTIAITVALVAWTVLNDAMVAFQDREEDASLGLGSITHLIAPKVNLWLSVLTIGTVGPLVYAGIVEGLSVAYFAFLALASFHIIWQVVTIDISNRENCDYRFNSNRHVGWLICAGIFFSYASF